MTMFVELTGARRSPAPGRVRRFFPAADQRISAGLRIPHGV